MTKRRRPTQNQRHAARKGAPLVKTIMPMIMTPKHRKLLLELIERFDELEAALQDNENEFDQGELEEEQNEIYESVFELVREMLGIPSPNHTGESQ